LIDLQKIPQHFTLLNSLRCKLHRLTVSLGDTLDLVLLLDGVTVGGAAGSIDDFVGQALGDGLDVAEGGLAGALRHEVQGLVHAAEGGHVHGLSAHHAGRADAGGVLSGSGVDDGVHQHLQCRAAGEGGAKHQDQTQQRLHTNVFTPQDQNRQACTW
jgi:hypothetical protein